MVPEAARYMSLETFRKSGAGVATPVWFATADGAYWVFSAGNAGKLKRLRNSARARIAECDARGKVAGPWAEARATLVDRREPVLTAYAALRAKYGWQMWLGDLYARLTGRINSRQIIRVQPNEATTQ